MSYLVLARKYRPLSFQEIVGQKPVVRTLQNALRQDRVAHALLFSGIRGTGKTTLARIMAKAINCENLQDADPCNSCSSCLSITDGGNLDLQEVDGASNRGIQEIRELKDKIRFQPTSSKYKIIIIDEVHMLTTEAFNALLKTLEEPPDHVFFMFATTELHKVPVTILSRCQRYELKRLTRQELAEHFNKISQKEGVTVSPEALELIVQEANGSVRDGLSLLDQIFSYSGNNVTTEDAADMLGVVNKQAIADLVDNLLDKNTESAFLLFNEICSQGVDLKRLTSELLEWLRNIILYKITSNQDVIDAAETDLIRLAESSQKFSIETLTGAFNILLEGFSNALRSTYSRLAIELVLLKLLHLKDVMPVTDLIDRFNDLLAGNDVEEIKCTPLQSEKEVIAPPPVPSDFIPKTPIKKSEPVKEVKKNKDVVSLNIKQSEEVVAKENKPEEKKPVIQTDKPVIKNKEQPPDQVKKSIRKDWEEFLLYVKDRQPWAAAALQRATSVKQKDNELLVNYDDSAECSILKEKQYISRLTEYVLDFFQENLTICFIVPGSDGCEIDTENTQKPHQERKMLASDPLVIMAQEIFNGHVGDIRIGPRFRHTEKVEESKSENEIEVN